MVIESLNLGTTSLEAMAEFYQEKLGLECTLTPTGFAAAVGTTQLSFHPTADTQPAHFAFNIPANQFDAALNFLSERGIDKLKDPLGSTEFDFDFWRARSVYFSDPEGNILEFIAREEVGPSSEFGILAISEVGIPQSDPRGAATQIQTALAIHPYSEPGEFFIPLGDAEGLLIVVPIERPWFPESKVPAGTASMTIRIRTDSGRFEVQTEPLSIKKIKA